MKIILLGAPGSGKGTQATKIAEKYGLTHISTGDIFRENIKNQTALGIKVKEIMDSGNLCPDGLTIELVKDYLTRCDNKNGYLLDGFPRNIVQAEALEGFDAPDKVIQLDVPFSKIESRILQRRVCSKCGASHNVAFIGNTDICPDCGGKLVIRKDDTKETVRERLSVYKEQTEPLVEYYKKKGKLFVIKSSDKEDVNVDERETIFADIVKVLG